MTGRADEDFLAFQEAVSEVLAQQVSRAPSSRRKVSARSLTTDLGRAREIAADVDRLMAGAREVEVLLRKASPAPK